MLFMFLILVFQIYEKRRRSANDKNQLNFLFLTLQIPPMKKTLTPLFFLLAFGLNAQTVNFWDIKNAFDEHWEDKEVSDTECVNGKEGGYQQFKRWEAFIGPRTSPSGELFDQE